MLNFFAIFTFCLLSFCTHADDNDIDPVLNDPCQNGEAVKLEQSLGYADSEGYPLENIFIDCKELPHDRYTAIIAVLFPSKEKDSFEQQGKLDAHLIHMDAVGEVLAQAQFSEVAYTGGMQLSGPIVDTGLYLLDSEVRAFGVRVFNQSHCSACEVDVEEGTLNLFYPTESRFRWIVRNMPVYKKVTQRASNEHACYHAGEEQKSVVQVSQSKSNQLFDLVVVTTTASVPGVIDDYVTLCKKRQPDNKKRVIWRFDGQQ